MRSQTMKPRARNNPRASGHQLRLPAVPGIRLTADLRCVRSSLVWVTAGLVLPALPARVAPLVAVAAGGDDAGTTTEGGSERESQRGGLKATRNPATLTAMTAAACSGRLNRARRSSRGVFAGGPAGIWSREAVITFPKSLASTGGIAISMLISFSRYCLA